TTDVFVTSDHGFATISRHEIDAEGHATASYSSGFTYLGSDGKPETPPGWLPPGFLAIDLAHALGLPLFDPDTQITVDGAQRYAPVDPTRPETSNSRQHPAAGDGLIGGLGAVQDPIDAKVIVTASGGTDLIYVPRHDRSTARRIVEFLVHQDYVGALFVDRALGEIPGALPLTAVALEGSSRMPRPSIVVGFKTFLLEPGNLLSAVQVSDTPLQEGQGMHGGFGRDSTFNNMAALGPDFKQGFTDSLPVSNADIAPTLAYILGLRLPHFGKLRGRVMSEALVEGSDSPPIRHEFTLAQRTTSGLTTVVLYQELQGRRYFDTACLVATQAHASGDQLCNSK